MTVCGVLCSSLFSSLTFFEYLDEREVPLSTALAIGVLSVEADIWLRDETNLLVGHTSGDLSDDKTLDSLYIQGILKNLNGESQIPTKCVLTSHWIISTYSFHSSSVQNQRRQPPATLDRLQDRWR